MEQEINITKVCKRCNVEQPINQFAIRTVNGRKYPRKQCRNCECALARLWYKKIKSANNDTYKKIKKNDKNKQLKSAYGITLEQYDALAKQQNYVCAVCGKHESNMHGKSDNLSRLCVDHDHVTGRIRGLLCHKCNVGIGHFEDRLDVLASAIAYLSKPCDENTIYKKQPVFKRDIRYKQ